MEVIHAMLDTEGSKPIYIQISEWIENEILKGRFRVDEKVYSQYKLADIFTINPATAAKGLNVLANEHILYDKRGLGKFVAHDAIEIIKDKRKNQTLKGLMKDIVSEASYLGLDQETVLSLLKETYDEMEDDQ